MPRTLQRAQQTPEPNQQTDEVTYRSQASVDASASTSSTLLINSFEETPDENEGSLVISTLMLHDIDYDILKITAGLADRVAAQAGQHTFADLFKAFEDFTHSNELTPALYSNYFVCLNILANLCQIDEPTWLKRLETLLPELYENDDDNIERADTIALSKELDKFESSTKERFLLVWHESLNFLKEKQTRLMSVARERNLLNIYCKAFRTWHDRYFSLIEREIQVIQKRDFQFREMIFTSEREMHQAVAQRTKRANWQLAANALGNWREKTKTIMHQESTADLMNRTNLLQSWFTSWRQITNEQIITKHHNARITRRYLGTWVNRAKLIYTLDTNVSHANRQICLEDTLSAWKQRYRCIRDVENKLVLFDLNLLLKTFCKWRKKQQHELLLDSCTYNLSNRQARLTFGEWKLKTRMSITASQFRDVTCLSNCFRTWRLNCRAHKLIALRFRGQVWDIYRDWYLKQRLARLQRLHNTTLASSAMAQWQFRLEEKDTQVNEKLSNFEIYLDMRIAKRVFHTWKTRRTEVLNMELDAEALYYDNIATASLFTLLHQYDVTVHNSTKAITISKEKTLSRYFHIWKNASLQHKKRNAYALLDRYTIEKEQRLKQKFFTQWDDKYLEKEDLVFQALSFYSHTNRTLQQKYLGQWLIRTIEITNQIEEAAEQNNQNLLIQSFQRWRDSKVSVDTLDSMCAEILPRIGRPSLAQAFRVWKMRMFKLNMKQKMAIDFEHRLTDLKLKMYWRHWRGRIQRNLVDQLSEMSVSWSRSSVTSDYSAVDSVDPGWSSPSLVLRTPTRNRSRRVLPLSSHSRTPFTPRH